MGARWEFSGIREVHILRDQKAILSIAGVPNLRVRTAVQPFVEDRMNIMPKIPQLLRQGERKILIHLDLHAAN